MFLCFPVNPIQSANTVLFSRLYLGIKKFVMICKEERH